MKKKISIISTYVGIPRVWKIAKALSTEYDVTVVEWARESNLPKSEFYQGIRVHRFSVRGSFGMSLISRLPLWMAFLSFLFIKYHFDIVIPQNLDTLFPIWVIAKLKRMKIVYDIADFYSDAYIPPQMNLLRTVISGIEQFLIGKVDAVLIADRSRFRQLGHTGKKKILVVYNTPVDIYDSLNSRFISKEDRTIFTIFYGGILSADRGLFQLVDIVQDIPNIRLVVAGFGSIEQEFIHYLEGKVNVSFLGRVPYDKILELTFASDCVAALYDPWIPNNRLASPNKLFEAMMCGKPIIASDQSSLSELVRRENCGLVICYHEIGELREAIYRLKDDRELRIELGKNARSAYLRNYNWFTIEQGILDLIKILVNKSNNFSR